MKLDKVEISTTIKDGDKITTRKETYTPDADKSTDSYVACGVCIVISILFVLFVMMGLFL